MLSDIIVIEYFVPPAETMPYKVYLIYKSTVIGPIKMVALPRYSGSFGMISALMIQPISSLSNYFIVINFLPYMYGKLFLINILGYFAP
jgi:hypothetical protein